MNIGIDFNTKTTKAATWVNGADFDDCKIFEAKNILVFSDGNIFSGDDGFNKFLTEKDSTVYELDQIIKWNGLIVNKKQISPEKCLSVIFANLLNKIKMHAPNNEVSCICVSIPYDKYYYWHGLMLKVFSLLGIEGVRIISQPAAFFCQPIYYGKNKYKDYLFVSISQDNTNVSSAEYSGDCLEIKSTQYTSGVTRRKIENSIFDYFISEIKKDSRNFALADRGTHLRILESVNEFLKEPQTGNTFELNLPYVLCEDAKYQTLDTKIDLITLRSFLSPIFNSLVETTNQLALKICKEWGDKYVSEMGDIIVVGDLFIQQNIKESLLRVFNGSKVVFGTEKSLAIGAFNYSLILTGHKKYWLALEVIPFSVQVRLHGGEIVEMIKKDTTVPTTSNEHSFEIKTESKSKFVEVHLTTKEGDAFQSLNVWKIEVPNVRNFKISVHIDPSMKIGLNAHSENGQKLSVQVGNTFSFSGTGFDVGIKGKDIRQYILNQFNYLNAVLDSKDVVIFEPDENFYSMLKDGEPFKALRYLGHFLKLKSLPDVEMADSKFFEEQGIGGFISGSKISIPKNFIKDPRGFGYVLAHELAHYILIHEEQIILDDEQENEILTEIFVIYSGMGKLFLNGFKSKDVESSSLHARGYLDEKILKYIHQIYLPMFNVNLSDYSKNLTSEAVKMLDELMVKQI